MMITYEAENPMTNPDFQSQVANFVAQHHLDAPVEARLLDLVSEVGEVAKEALKGSDYGKQPFQPTAEWSAEVADVFFSLVCVANSTNVNLETALAAALAKYQQRLTSKGEAGSGR